MYKVLFAEDESATRSGILASIDWQSLGISEVRAEKNGALAARAAEEGFCPDILLTDIKMPRMDGIALSHRIREKNPQCSILMISGYTEVDYLKSAIQLKAVNFVDKPIKLDELQEQLRRAVQEQDELREKKALFKTEIGSMLRYSGFSTQRLELILRELYPQMPRAIFCQAALVRILTAEGGPFADAGLQGVLAAVQAALPRTGAVCISAIHKSCIQLSLFGEQQLPLQAVCDALTAALPLYSLYFCAGAVLPLHAYEQSLQQASALLQQIFYDRNKHLLTPAQSISFAESVQLPDLQPLSELLKSKERESVKKYICSLLRETIFGEKVLSPNSASELCFRILLKLLPGENTLPADNRDSAAEWMASCVFLEQMEQELLQEVDRCFDSIDREAGAPLIDRVLAYVKENYRDRELSLNSLSRHFYVSNVYLCIRFKERVGQTFVRYLTEIRVQQASRLLRDSDMKISAIAESVGFDNGSYFTKIFKREVGVTSAEYRKAAAQEA